MIKQIAIITTALLLLAILPLVIAEGETNTSENAPEVIEIATGSENNDDSQTVDSATSDEINDDLNGSASSANIAMIKVKNWFTFNQEKKAELELKIARLQLVRAKIAAQNNNTVAMEKAIEAHNKIMERIQTRIEKIDGASTKENIRKAAEKVVGLERAIQVHEAKISKLNEVIANSNLSEDQIEKVQARIEHMENVTAHLKEVEIAKKDVLETKLVAIGKMSENEAASEIKNIERAKNLTAVRNRVLEIKEIRAEKVAQTLTNVIAKLETRANETGKNHSVAISKLTVARDRMQARAENLEARQKAVNSLASSNTNTVQADNTATTANSNTA